MAGASFPTSQVLLKVIEAVLCLLVFVSAMVPYSLFTHYGGSWAQAVSVLALFGVVAILIVKSARGDNLPPVFHLTVMLFYLAFDFLLFSVGILAAVRASQMFELIGGSSSYSRRSAGLTDIYPESVAACAAFLLTAFVVFFCDTFYAVSAYRSTNANAGSVRSTVQTTTAVTY